MEPMRKHSSSFQTKSRSRRMCLSVDSSCCHYISSSIRKPFNAQRKKWWSFKQSSTTNAAILQGTNAPGPSCSDAASTRSCPRPRPQFIGPHYKRKQALAVAIASVAAAEAAMVAAEAAAHMANLTLTPANRSRGNLQAETLAAIKIQSAFRGHLVRKALRVTSKAGLVRLQSIAHGRVGQAQCATTMQSMQELVRARQAGVRRKPCKQQLWVRETPIDTSTCMHNTSKEISHESLVTPVNTEQVTEEEIQPIHSEAKLHWNWLEHWMATRLHGSLNCHSTKYMEKSSLPQPQLVPTPRHATNWSSRPSRQVRYQKSSSASSNASGDVQSVASFSGMPNYMVDTESTRAKIRAHSAPRQRIATRCISLGNNSPLQQQPHFPSHHHSSLCPRHLSHMTHSEHHHATTKRKF